MTPQEKTTTGLHRVHVLHVSEDMGTAFIWLEPADRSDEDGGTNWLVSIKSMQAALGLSRPLVEGDGGVIDLSLLEQLW